MVKRVKLQPKKATGWLLRKLPWYGKILIPIVVMAVGIYLLEWIASLFV